MAVSQSLTVTQTSQSVEGNYSKVRILWTSTQTGASYNAYTRTAYYYVSINGGAEVTYSVSYTLPKNTTKTILDTTITVPHLADGTGSVKVRTWLDTRISAGVFERSQTLALDDIPRATTPTLHASAVDMGDTVTIYLYRAVPEFTHDLYYSFMGGEFQYIAGDLDTVYYWALPDMAEQIPNAASGTVTIRCVTKNGDTVIGTKTVLLTARVPGSVMPTIPNIAVTEATEGMAAQFGAFVKDKSTLAVAVTAAGAKGSTIKSYSTTVEGIVYTGQSFTTDVVTTSGELSVAVTVTDSRGRSVRLTKKVNVLDYFLPVTTEFTVYRVDQDGNAKSDGDYMTAAYAYNVAPVGNRNTAAMRIEYKRTTATTWSTLMTGSDLAGSGVVKFDKLITSDYQFDVKLTVVDWFGAEASYSATLPTAKVILDIKAEGDGLAAGKTAEFPGFEVDLLASGESFKMIGVRSYEIGDAYGHILYNSGLLLQWGMVSVTPTAINTVTQLRTVFQIPYKHRPHITGTLLANSPQVVDWGMGIGGSDYEALTGLMVYMIRTTMHATPIRWMAIGLADPTQLPEVTAE